MKQLPDTIEGRQERLKTTEKYLKKKFVGIDEQITEVIRRISYWYVFPQDMETPLIINLWGPTGVGKTDLIRELVDQLGLSNAYFEKMLNQDENSNKIFFDIQEEADCLLAGEQGVIVFDEFQKFRTKDRKGDPLTGTTYTDIWQLLSDGKIIRRMSKSSAMGFMTSLGWQPGLGFRLDLLSKKKLTRIGHRRYRDFFLSDTKGDDTPEEGQIPMADLISKNYELMEKCIPKFKNFAKFKNKDHLVCLGRSAWETPSEMMEIIDEIEKYSRFVSGHGFTLDGTVDSVLKGLEKIMMNSLSEEMILTHNLTKTAFFILGNLDNIYQDALKKESVFIPANYYRKWCDSITIFDVTQELSEYFFDEQVARLGSNHILYATLGESHYQELISRSLKSFSKKLGKQNLSVSFDKSVHQNIYKNFVKPLKGVRPLFAGLHVVQSVIMGALLLIGKSTKKIKVSYDLEQGAFLFCEGSKVLIKESFIGDVDRVIKNADPSHILYQSIHEIGHAIVAYILSGVTPLFCVMNEDGAITVGESSGESVVSEKWNKIVFTLGGCAATDIVYGISQRKGISADIQSVAYHLQRMAREEGNLEFILKKLDLQAVQNNYLMSLPYVSQHNLHLNGENPIRDNAEEEYHFLNLAYKKAHLEAIEILMKEKKAILTIGSLLAKKRFLGGEELKGLLKKHVKQPLKNPM